MNKKITAVTLTAIMVLTMFTALVPAASGVEQVEAPYEFYAYIITDIDNGVDDYVYLDSINYPSILYYDLDEGEGNEVLEFTIDNDNQEINDTNFVYNTTMYPRDNDWDKPYIAWLGAPYFVVDNESDFYLSELLWDDETTDDVLLRVGETMTLKEGVTVTPLEIDVDGGEAWFSVSQDGEEVESTVTKEGNVFEWLADLNDNNEDDNPVVRFNVETVFAGMNTNIVKINETWQVSTDVVIVEDNDKDTLDDFVINIINAETLEILLDEDEIGLKKDGIVSFLDDRFNIKVNEDGEIAAVVKIVEIGGVPTPTPTTTATPSVNVTEEPDVNVTVGPPTAGPTDAGETEAPTPEPTEKEPGFEAVFAVAGLLAVAYLVLRQRE